MRQLADDARSPALQALALCRSAAVQTRLDQYALAAQSAQTALAARASHASRVSRAWHCSG